MSYPPHIDKAVLILKLSLQTHAPLDLLLHPRLPPIVRPIPSTNALTLFRVEESEEEAFARKTLGLEFAEGLGEHNPADQDTEMQDSFVPPPWPAATTKAAEPVRPTQPSAASFSASNLPPASHPEDTTPAPAAPTFTPAPFANWKPTTVVPRATSSAVASTSSAVASTSSAAPPRLVSDDEEDEDEEMPTIDLGSDSEDEEE